MTDDVRWFSHTVPEAHGKFVSAAQSAGLEVEAVMHPLRGPDGEVIHSAIAEVGPADADNVLLCISGIHGIEGYFGSAIQCDALANRGELLSLPAGTKAVFVHLVNPWGTAWSSRENEDNVELLRGNYYCHFPKPPNPIFDEFHETMGYSRITSIEEFLAGRGRISEMLKRHRIEDIMTALGDGQNSHPDAITWVGNGPTWSKHLLDRVIVERCGAARRFLVFDLHTAVGPPGETVVFTGSKRGSPRELMVRNWFRGEVWDWPEELEFYRWVAELVPGSEVVSLTMEAGTEQLGPEGQYIFPLDVWIKIYGDRDDPAAASRLTRYRRFFYPETEEWMRSTLAHGRTRWKDVLSGFDEWIQHGYGARQ